MSVDKIEGPHAGTVYYVRITGWRDGAEKIEGTKTIRRYTDLGLDKAKRCIDDALGGAPTDIRASNEKVAKELCSALDGLGWDCSVIPRASH